ncbi:hypothetical protein FRC01_005546 [Tulasnella sp. 417]|nr:hypothetical protein FRC01_005546 [Tulasnella sp. 417]
MLLPTFTPAKIWPQPSAVPSDSPAIPNPATSTTVPSTESPKSDGSEPAAEKTSNAEANDEEKATAANSQSNDFDGAESGNTGERDSPDSGNPVPPSDESRTLPPEEPLSGEIPSLESFMAGIKLQEGQSEAARAVIPVLWRSRKEEETLLNTGKNLLQDVQTNPLPTSSKGLTLGEMISIIGTRREREYTAQRLVDQRKALNQERFEALHRLQPHVTLVGNWLETHGPRPQQPPPSIGDEIDVVENSDTGGYHQVSTCQSPERSDQDRCSDEQEGVDATEDVAAAEDSSGDSDLEDQLRQCQESSEPDAENQVGGGSTMLDEQTSLR